MQLRILTTADTWQGATDYGYIRALRRQGHSVLNVPHSNFLPGWRRLSLRALRRFMSPWLVRDYSEALLHAACAFQPDLFFVCKGPYITPQVLERIKAENAVAIQFFPDVSMFVHGPYLPKALPLYDWVFTSKSYGVDDLRSRLNCTHASYLAHGFDEEVHRPVHLAPRDQQQYGCDASFIGNWSPNKERTLASLKLAMPKLELKIWGPAAWRGAVPVISRCYQGYAVTGDEYAKAISATCINIALLSEQRAGASSGDLTTTRTFEIPAVGGFMLHQETAEVREFFQVDQECGLFEDDAGLVRQIKYYLANPELRKRIAKEGHLRATTSGYSIDSRARVIVDKYCVLRNICA